MFDKADVADDKANCITNNNNLFYKIISFIPSSFYLTEGIV